MRYPVEVTYPASCVQIIVHTRDLNGRTSYTHVMNIIHANTHTNTYTDVHGKDPDGLTALDWAGIMQTHTQTHTQTYMGRTPTASQRLTGQASCKDHKSRVGFNIRDFIKRAFVSLVSMHVRMMTNPRPIVLCGS
jgi:hypothetical protein